MRILYTLIIALLLTLASVSAQQSGTIVYRKDYAADDYDRVDTLYFDRVISKYVQYQEPTRYVDAEGFNVTLSPRDQQTYLNRKNNSIVDLNKNFKKKRIDRREYKWKNYEWTLYDEFKTIGEYSTQKATIEDHKHPDYQGATVWFTSEISLPYGPDMMYGLPGLIIEAEIHGDFDHTWKLESIEYSDFDLIIPTGGTLVDEKGKKLNEEERKRLRALLNSEG